MRPNPDKMSPEAAKQLSYSINTVAGMLEQRYPATWKRMCTKTIDAPGKYYSSRALPVGLTCAIEESRVQGANLETNIGIVAGRMEEHDFPLYYVSEPLLQALKKSHPPENMKWEDIKLPFPALAFMLPRGCLQEPEKFGGNDIVFVGACSLPLGFMPQIPTVGSCGLAIPEYSRICCFWGVAPSCLIIHDTTFPASHPLEPLSEWIDLKTAIFKDEYYGPTGVFSAYVAGVIANLILVMEARKELVEPGRRIAFKKPREGKPGVWTPTFIGRNYQVLRKEADGSRDAQGHFTEIGWRSGHFKRQHFGKGWEQVKTIWVDPYIAFTRGLQPVGEGPHAKT